MNEKESSRLRPGQEVPEWELFEVRTNQETGEEVGFRAPDGRYYHFRDGETLSHDKMGDDEERKTFIVLQDGTRVPFETWKKSYKE